MHLDPIGAAVPENYVRVSYLIGISRGCYEGLELSCADLLSTTSGISHDPVNSATPWQVDLFNFLNCFSIFWNFLLRVGKELIGTIFLFFFILFFFLFSLFLGLPQHILA